VKVGSYPAASRQPGPTDERLGGGESHRSAG